MTEGKWNATGVVWFWDCDASLCLLASLTKLARGFAVTLFSYGRGSDRIHIVCMLDEGRQYREEIRWLTQMFSSLGTGWLSMLDGRR